ncbi:MAG TPA: oligopeptide/dipeptide ABC transporter ATP-binding protein [Burkholderiaceae bacterium]|nr:oligopeptide/dipeptide ABC transporter ATP-binding protein [Burkholderiaceae bacterium]
MNGFLPKAGLLPSTAASSARVSASGVPETAAQDAPPLLRARGLVRRFKVRSQRGLFGGATTLTAVNDVSFDIHAGRTLGLVGESGCGKSTTARLTLGLTPVTAGEIAFDGMPVNGRRTAHWRELRRHMQMVYQDPLSVLDKRLPMLSQVIEPLDIFAVGERRERAEQARAMLSRVGLSQALWQRYPHELSGGQRQRAVLARALILQPRLLVCDEPISALDVSIQAQVINLLQDLQQEHHLGMLFISHDLKVVRQICDEVAVMYLGRIVEQGTPQELFAHPAHPYTQALVSAIPTPQRAKYHQRILLDGDPPNPINLPSGCAFHPRCPVATARCRQETPALQDLPDGRKVACLNASTPTLKS